MIAIKFLGGAADGIESCTEDECVGVTVLIGDVKHEYIYSHYEGGVYFFVPYKPLGIKFDFIEAWYPPDQNKK